MFTSMFGAGHSGEVVRASHTSRARSVPLWFTRWSLVFAAVVVSAQAAAWGSSAASMQYPDLFEGPEKTLSLRFSDEEIQAGSLRAIPRAEWEAALVYAKCEILSAIESGTPIMPNSSEVTEAATKAGLTGYLLSESSLFLSDTTLTLKTCGRTTPLAALEPILDLVVPSWRSMEAERYLKYASFARLGYMRPDEQVEPHTSWEQEVDHMEKYFVGEAIVLGSADTSKQHVYVASYLSDGEDIQAASVQVALTNLDTSESMLRYGGGPAGPGAMLDPAPLATAWPTLHRGSSEDTAFDERFFEPIGYSSNAVAGKYYTNVHITPQPGCSYLSVETSEPLANDDRERFVTGVQGMGGADTLAFTEIYIGRSRPQADDLDIFGFEMQKASRAARRQFSVTHVHYERVYSTTTTPSPPAQNTSFPIHPAQKAKHLAKSCESLLLRREYRASGEGAGEDAEHRAACAVTAAAL